MKRPRPTKKTTTAPALYPAHWRERGPRPGDDGFNAYCQGLLRRAGLRPVLECPGTTSKARRDQWYQQVLAYLVHPATPIDRLLVVWQLGAGKTLGMLRVLSNYADDPRPKVLVFPTEALVSNFYEELLRWGDNPYAKWVEWQRRRQPERAGGMSTREMLETGHSTRRWGTGNTLAAPLRAFSYTIAGGRSILTSNPVLRWGPPSVVKSRAATMTAAFNGCIVLCDEAHHLVHPGRAVADNKARRDLVLNVGARLKAAVDAVVVLFTATPVVTNPATDAASMLDIVRGARPVGNKEGYVSWFMARPSVLFASLTMAEHAGGGEDSGVLGMPIRIDVPLTGAPLQKYLRERFGMAGVTARPKPSMVGACVGTTLPNGRACKATIASYEAQGFYWLRPPKAVTKEGDGGTPELAVKAHRLSQIIAEDPDCRKTAVILHRESGAEVLGQLLSQLGVATLVLRPGRGRDEARQNAADIARFNAPDNVLGGRFRVIVLLAEQHSEGVSLRQVRRLVLGDLSPGNGVPHWPEVQQRIGRALRMCAHQDLPAELRVLTVECLVAVHTVAHIPKTLDEEKWDMIAAERQAFASALDGLRAISIDATLYRDRHPAVSDA